jgi:hypothetical protein
MATVTTKPNGAAPAARRDPPSFRLGAADLMEHRANVYRKVVPAGVTAEDLIRPGTLLFDRANEGDVVHVQTSDRRRLFELYVVRVYSGGQDLALLATHDLPELPALHEAGLFPSGFRAELLSEVGWQIFEGAVPLSGGNQRAHPELTSARACAQYVEDLLRARAK